MNARKNPVSVMIGSNITGKAAIVAKASAEVASMLSDAVTAGPLTGPDYTGIGSDYCNMLVAGQTGLGADELKEKFREMEIRYGRQPGNKAEVALDIDIVVFAGQIIKPLEYDSETYGILSKSLEPQTRISALS